MIGILKGNPHEFFEILYNNRDDFLKQKGLSRYVSVGDAISDLLAVSHRSFRWTSLWTGRSTLSGTRCFFWYLW